MWPQNGRWPNFFKKISSWVIFVLLPVDPSFLLIVFRSFHSHFRSFSCHLRRLFPYDFLPTVLSPPVIFRSLSIVFWSDLDNNRSYIIIYNFTLLQFARPKFNWVLFQFLFPISYFSLHKTEHKVRWKNKHKQN